MNRIPSYRKAIKSISKLNFEWWISLFNLGLKNAGPQKKFLILNLLAIYLSVTFCFDFTWSFSKNDAKDSYIIVSKVLVFAGCYFKTLSEVEIMKLPNLFFLSVLKESNYVQEDGQTVRGQVFIVGPRYQGLQANQPSLLCFLSCRPF